MSIRRIGGSGGRLRWAMSATAVVVALLTAFTAQTSGTSVQDRQQPIFDWLKSVPDLAIREAFRVVGIRQDDSHRAPPRTVYIWRTAPPSAVLANAFRRLGEEEKHVYELADLALLSMGMRLDQRFTEHSKYATSSGVEMLTDALRGVGVDADTASALASVLAADMGIDPGFDEAQLEKLRARVADVPRPTDLPLDGAHATAFLERLHSSFTAVGYLDREADAFIDTLRDRWNLRGDDARRPNEPVLDWRRSNLHLVLTDAFVLAAGHTRADARQLAYNAMLQLNLGISAETFDRRGESVEAHPSTAVFKHDPRGMTSRRVYTTHRNAPVPADLSFTLVVDDLAAEFTLDERAAQPVLKSVLDLPSRTVIRR